MSSGSRVGVRRCQRQRWRGDTRPLPRDRCKRRHGRREFIALSGNNRRLHEDKRGWRRRRHQRQRWYGSSCHWGDKFQRWNIGRGVRRCRRCRAARDGCFGSQRWRLIECWRVRRGSGHVARRLGGWLNRGNWRLNGGCWRDRRQDQHCRDDSIIRGWRTRDQPDERKQR